MAPKRHRAYLPEGLDMVVKSESNAAQLPTALTGNL